MGESQSGCKQKTQQAEHYKQESSSLSGFRLSPEQIMIRREDHEEQATRLAGGLADTLSVYHQKLTGNEFITFTGRDIIRLPTEELAFFLCKTMSTFFKTYKSALKKLGQDIGALEEGHKNRNREHRSSVLQQLIKRRAAQYGGRVSDYITQVHKAIPANECLIILGHDILELDYQDLALTLFKQHEEIAVMYSTGQAILRKLGRAPWEPLP